MCMLRKPADRLGWSGTFREGEPRAWGRAKKERVAKCSQNVCKMCVYKGVGDASDAKSVELCTIRVTKWPG